MAWTFPDHDKQVKHTRINNSNNSGRNIPASMQGKCTKCGKNQHQDGQKCTVIGENLQGMWPAWSLCMYAFPQRGMKIEGDIIQMAEGWLAMYTLRNKKKLMWMNLATLINTTNTHGQTYK